MILYIEYFYFYFAFFTKQQNNKTNTRYLNVNNIKVSLMNYAGLLGLKKTEAQYFFTVLKKIQHVDDEVSLWIG